MNRISITAARDHLTRLIRHVEAGQPVELTRHGKSVAVLLSSEDYDQLARERAHFSETYAKFRQTLPKDLDLDPDAVFEGIRDRNSGRDFSFEG